MGSAPMARQHGAIVHKAPMFGVSRAAALAAAGRHVKRSTVAAGAAAATAAAAAASTAAAVAWCSASLDPEQARSLGRRWVEEEATPGYVPPSASWPPPAEQPARSHIPALSAASAACGGADGGGGECQRITFSLAVALLGGALFGHSPNDTQAAEPEPTEAERAHGARLMRRLAEQGMPAALCGWALCLLDGEVAAQDVPAAVRPMGVRTSKGTPALPARALHRFRSPAARTFGRCPARLPPRRRRLGLCSGEPSPADLARISPAGLARFSPASRPHLALISP